MSVAPSLSTLPPLRYRLGIDSIDKLRSKLGEMRSELQDPHRFQEVYNYSFQWACEVRTAYKQRCKGGGLQSAALSSMVASCSVMQVL